MPPVYPMNKTFVFIFAPPKTSLMAHHTTHIDNDDGMITKSLFSFPSHIFRAVHVPCLMAKHIFLRLYVNIVLLIIKAGIKNSVVIRAVVTVMVVARALI